MCHFSFATFDVCFSSLTFNIVTVMLPSLSFVLLIMIDVHFVSWIWKFLVKFGEFCDILSQGPLTVNISEKLILLEAGGKGTILKYTNSFCSYQQVLPL